MADPHRIRRTVADAEVARLRAMSVRSPRHRATSPCRWAWVLVFTALICWGLSLLLIWHLTP